MNKNIMDEVEEIVSGAFKSKRINTDRQKMVRSNKETRLCYSCQRLFTDVRCPYCGCSPTSHLE